MASINRLNPLLAIVVGVLHVGLAPVLVVAGVQPNLAIIAVVLVCAARGLQTGATWAFSAGMTVNLLSGEPLGSIPLALLLVVGLVASSSPAFARLPAVHAVASVFGGSVVYDVVGLLLRQATADGSWSGMPLGVVLAAAALNTSIAAVVLLVVRLVEQRRARPRSARLGRWPA